jgi:hypothetical protein
MGSERVDLDSWVSVTEAGSRVTVTSRVIRQMFAKQGPATSGGFAGTEWVGL